MAELKNLGLIGIKSHDNRYLQAHTDGEMHAGNPKRNEEETWFLWEVDAASDTYAIQNWRTGTFLRTMGNGCTRSDLPAVTSASQWVFEKGATRGILNGVALKNIATGCYLEANSAGENVDPCGGEVACGRPFPPNTNEPTATGWWYPEAATPPSEGKNIWNTVGGFFLGVATNLAPAAIGKLLGIK